MNKEKLVSEIVKKRSCLCIGLDTDIRKIPKHLNDHPDPISAFNKEIISNTHKYCVAYKPNLAFYEEAGYKGWQALEKTMHEYIPRDIFTIADAKRGDLGNSSKMYAKSAFENFAFDAVTVSPYMGMDSIEPFLEYEDKWVIVLLLTSNPGSNDLQMAKMYDGGWLYEKVLEMFVSFKNVMFVVGATQSQNIQKIREMAPDNFLLVPGIGFQGGDLETTCKYGFNEECGVLINASRSVIYSSYGEDFGEAAGRSAENIQSKIAVLLEKNSFPLLAKD